MDWQSIIFKTTTACQKKSDCNKTMIERNQRGSHRVKINDENLSSGVYLYRIEAGEFQDVKKMILIR
jgi:hypothetical protein